MEKEALFVEMEGSNLQKLAPDTQRKEIFSKGARKITLIRAFQRRSQPPEKEGNTKLGPR